MVEILASGLVGALLATILGAVFDFFREQARLRADVMLTVVGWAALFASGDRHQRDRPHCDGRVPESAPGRAVHLRRPRTLAASQDHHQSSLPPRG